MTFSTLFLSAITAAVGFQIGKSQSAALEQSHYGKNALANPETDSSKKSWLSSVLLPNIEQQETLEDLLREIDQNRRLAANTDYLFPDELKSERALPIPDRNEGHQKDETQISEVTEIPPLNDTPSELPDVDPNPLPTTGWAIQVGSYPTLADAQKRSEELSTNHPQVYVVTGSVNGET